MDETSIHPMRRVAGLVLTSKTRTIPSRSCASAVLRRNRCLTQAWQKEWV